MTSTQAVTPPCQTVLDVNRVTVMNQPLTSVGKTEISAQIAGLKQVDQEGVNDV